MIKTGSATVGQTPCDFCSQPSVRAHGGFLYCRDCYEERVETTKAAAMDPNTGTSCCGGRGCKTVAVVSTVPKHKA